MIQMEKSLALHSDELKKLQMVLLDMLSEVDRICRKHDINYTMIGGTLLGAIRYKGFIPWDDDVDVSMMRSEYEKFKNVCSTDLDHDRFFLQDNTTDPEYRWGYARLRRKDSEFIRVGQEHMKMKTGIFLDIYPGDKVPDFYPLRVMHALCCFALRKTLYAQTGAVTGKNALIRLVYRTLNLIPATFVFRRIETLIRCYSGRQTKFIRALTFPTPKGGKCGFPARWFEETDDMEFEGRMFKAICAYDEYLIYKYGDYMSLPPENKRHWHPAAVLKLPSEYSS